MNGYPYSEKWRQITQETGPCEHPLLGIEITHPLLSEPARFIADSDSVVSNGKTYLATGVEIVMPDDGEDQNVRASIRLINTDRSIGLMFEKTFGGRGAKIRLIQLLRSNPDNIERSETLDLSGVTINDKSVGLQLSLDDTVNKTGTPYTYRPRTKPGLS